MQALARTVFAFSRDRLIPLSRIWVVVNKKTGTPLYAVWFSVFWCIAINLIGLGSYAAISGVFNVTAIALDWSYVIPIFCKMVFGRFEPGPWNLGKFSWAVNFWACTWTLFVSIIFILPTLYPVTALNMNYAIAFLGAIFIAAAIFWYIPKGGKVYYTGPLIEAEVMPDDQTSGSDENAHEKEREHDYDQVHAAPGVAAHRASVNN